MEKVLTREELAMVYVHEMCGKRGAVEDEEARKEIVAILDASPKGDEVIRDLIKNCGWKLA